MCGIFGLFARQDAGYFRRNWQNAISQLFALSQTRGKEAAGLAIVTPRRLSVYKDSATATQMLVTREYRAAIDRAIEGVFSEVGHQVEPIGAIGHSRLVTNGLQGIDVNNQPVLYGDVVVVHNGIVVNVDALWQTHGEIKMTSEVDTEVFAALVDDGRQKGLTPVQAMIDVFNQIVGECSVAILFRDLDLALIGTNTGSLYVGTTASGTKLFFASERHICQQFIGGLGAKDGFAGATITQVRSGRGLAIDLKTLKVTNFALTFSQPTPQISTTLGLQRALDDKAKRFEQCRKSMRRCSRCILPETMPFIAFNENGICNYCNDYEPHKLSSENELEARLDAFRSKDGSADCLVTFSGGRDSSYGLHLLRTKFQMNPIAFTYDWGMVTDLARRNQARICGQLGIEHIWLSADIKAKRANVRRNVLAWLRQPDLGMIPLFTAGDKQFLYYANQTALHAGLKLIVWCTNGLEKTDFKTGFLGVQPKDATMLFTPSSMEMFDKVNLVWQYGRRMVRNPRYVNPSIKDTLFASFSYFLVNQDYLSLYDHYKWNEREIDTLLFDTYKWETAPDSKSTWRIGDATAPFYNYIYLSVAGFTEHDTFRSNQIREGEISRDDALRLVEQENVPRWSAIREYTQLINIDFDETIRTIDRIPKLYVGDL